jgi:uncharacterized membrane protein YphA (DoxX/SURF4 family)
MHTDAKLNINCKLLAIGRIFLGALFIYASWDKILDPAAFAAVITNYQILPAMLVNVTALVLPWLELVCGICLVLNRWTRGSALIVLVLMVVFLAALGSSAYRGIDIACGCFTLTGEAPKNMWGYLARDVALLALAITLLIHPKARTPILTLFKSNAEHSGNGDRHAV